MFERKPLFTLTAALFTGGLILLIALSMPATVHADGPAPDNGSCIKCHENLYFLHDTGNWFCLKESPMTCVDCHGGDSTTMTKELAHANRAAHPVINDDVSKCQQCHPEQCAERVEIFDQTAGISNVLVAAPYTPSYSSEVAENIPLTGQKAEKPTTWLNLMEIFPILLVSGIALVVYFYYKTRHTS